METLRNYLENLFMNLPNTPQVQKAKEELMQMMEDKYMELKAEGKTENEAIGIVISEFGNLEELAESLGIYNVVHNEPGNNASFLHMDEAKKFLSDRMNNAFRIALGVFLCITSVIGPITGDVFHTVAASAIGSCMLFIMVSIAVGLFIYSGMNINEWERIKKGYVMDCQTTEYVKRCKEEYKTNHIMFITLGVIFCVLSVTPVILLNGIFPYSDIVGDLSSTLLFLFVGAGVFMLVFTGIRMDGYEMLLKISNGFVASDKISGVQQAQPYFGNNYGKKEDRSLFWTTVSCIYVSWSFLTFDWHITWIIWPVAAVINCIINAFWRKDR